MVNQTFVDHPNSSFPCMSKTIHKLRLYCLNSNIRLSQPLKQELTLSASKSVGESLPNPNASSKNVSPLKASNTVCTELKSPLRPEEKTRNSLTAE